MMYEKYAQQSLPTREYRELLGAALCVFNSNNAFIIENILRGDNINATWYELVDKESGNLKPFLLEWIDNKDKELTQRIITLFGCIVNKRNRIVHSFQITDKDGDQILATKEKDRDGGKQFYITTEFLYEFIKENDELSTLLHKLRGC